MKKIIKSDAGDEMNGEHIYEWIGYAEKPYYDGTKEDTKKYKKLIKNFIKKKWNTTKYS